MRPLFCLLIACSALLLVGCGNSNSQPLTSGTIVSGTMWHGPPGLPGAGTGTILEGAHVDVYEHVVVATLADGSIHVAPLEWCAPLTIKK